MSNIIDQLTRNMKKRDIGAEVDLLVEKWEAIGLLEGVNSEHSRGALARILENQAARVLQEASTMQSGNVEGFAAVAFPIVRRVFGNLMAMDLVSVQSMSLPSGLIFFLDFTYTNSRLGQVAGESVFGQGVVGKQVTGGVDLTGDNAEKSAYSLNNGYTLPTASFTVTTTAIMSGVVGSVLTGSNADLNKIVGFDPDLSGSMVAVATVPLASFNTGGNALNEKDFVAITMTGLPAGYKQARRLTALSGSSKTVLTVVMYSSASTVPPALATAVGAIATYTAPIVDTFAAGGALGSVKGGDFWGLENEPGIPEIDIKVDSISITAITRKMKAKWTPELGQDLNAYHNVDAEVELSALLAEHIELEINYEIMEDLVKGATAAVRYWSRRPGKFLDKNGLDISAGAVPPDFTGNVTEWNQTIMDKINDVSAIMHRKLRRGGANFIVCGPEVSAILEFTRGFVGNISVGDDKGTTGVQTAGSINKKLDVHVDPYFGRNLILIGRKGSSFLESGYVYAPYVPLQLTPVIFDPESFVPRKGIATRYAKKMVLPDMYGKLYVLDLEG
jgi:hypothetical protein